MALKIFGNGLEAFQSRLSFLVISLHAAFQTMVDMILNERTLGIDDSLFNCMQLLGNVAARLVPLNHFNDMAKMARSALEASNNLWVAGMKMWFCFFISFIHGETVSPWGG